MSRSGTRVVLNPHAGGCRDEAACREELARLRDAEIRATEGPGHARTLARDAVEAGFDRVVAAGGDGTVHEVVNGLAADLGSVALGVAPLGTADDFARSLDLPDDLPSAVDVLLRDARRPLDVMEMSGPPDGPASAADEREGDEEARGGTDGPEALRHGVNVLVGGFGGEVGEDLDEEAKRHRGSLAYLGSALRELPRLPSFRASLEVDGRAVDRELVNLVVANGRFTGGHIPVAPDARLDDGQLQIVLLAAAGLGELARAATRIVAGQRVEGGPVTRLVAREVVVRSEPPMRFRCDGEAAGSTPLRVRVLHRALPVVVRV